MERNAFEHVSYQKKTLKPTRNSIRRTFIAHFQIVTGFWVAGARHCSGFLCFVCVSQLCKLAIENGSSPQGAGVLC